MSSAVNVNAGADGFATATATVCVCGNSALPTLSTAKNFTVVVDETTNEPPYVGLDNVGVEPSSV